MYYEKDSRTFNVVAGLALGAVVGVVLAFLTAPSGVRRTRRRVVKTISGVTDKAGARWGEISSDLRTVILPGRRRIRR
jgi:gas vesicle protein